RLRLAMEAMLQVRPADRRRCVRPQSQRAAAPILEGVHLLLNNIRSRAGRAREELGVLENGGLDAAIAVERAEALDLARDALPGRLGGRPDGGPSARRLEPLAPHA